MVVINPEVNYLHQKVNYQRHTARGNFNMAGFWTFVVILSIGTLNTSAQSGRRTAPNPTPSPTSTSADPGQYSESKPRTTRSVNVSERFPGIGISPNRPTPAASPTSVVPEKVATDTDGAEVLRVETNLVTIPVSVFDRSGLYIPNIRQSEFKIFEDGVEQEIAYFGTTDKPFTVALVLDVSPSTSYKIEEIQRAAIAFVDQLQPQDKVIVIEFDHGVNVRTKPTNDREVIYKAIKKADFGNGTSLYNAVDEAIRKQLGPIPGRKAVVLFTDGVDTTSRKNSYDGTLKYAEESDSMIFPIYYNTYYDNRPRNTGGYPDIFGGGIIAGVSPEDYALGRRYLEELAEVTGGRVFRPESTPGGLTRAFEGIAEELRRQYNIGFVPKDEGKRGQRRSIKVRVERPNLLVRARDSYIVGGAPVLSQPDSPVKSTNN
jgi:Ca-activated chloride channel homolog